MKLVKISDLSKEAINKLIDEEERFYVISGDDESALLPGDSLSGDAYSFWSSRNKPSGTVHKTDTGEDDSSD